MWPDTLRLSTPPAVSARESEPAPALQTRALPGMAAIDRAGWTAALPRDAEGWAYLAACEAGPPPGMELRAVAVRDPRGFAAGAPLFALNYRLDTPLQGGPLERVCNALARRLPRLLEWRMLGVGSPFTEHCPVAVHPRLTRGERETALAALIGEVEAEAVRRGAGLVAFKDISAARAPGLTEALAARRYFPVESLPLAVLDLAEYPDAESYLAGLSKATRKDLRRKMKGSGSVTVSQHCAITGMEHEFAALYAETQAQSALRYNAFEDLPADYFQWVSQTLKERAIFVCYRVNGVLAAFNLLFVEHDRVIDKFLGMRYPLAREHDLYAISWMYNVRLCQSIGRRYLQTGQTAYASKLRFGSGLVPSVHYVKHRNPLLHGALRQAAPMLAFPRWDPDLKAHRARAAA